MIDLAQVKEYLQERFHEDDSSDRIDDRGFAYYIDTQPREYLDTKDESKMTLGNGPMVIVKATGDVFLFSSNPMHMFGNSGIKIGVNAAKTAEEFQTALDELKEMNDYAATHPVKITGSTDLKPVKINSIEEALRYVDTTIRKRWEVFTQNVNYELGEATIQKEVEVMGHKAWDYYIDGLPMSRDGRRRWLLDTGETVETTLKEGENTIEKAYEKQKRMQTALAIAESQLKENNPNFSKEKLIVREVEVGYMVYQEDIRGVAVIVGNDGGALTFGSLTNPDDAVQAYKDGKRSE